MIKGRAAVCGYRSCEPLESKVGLCVVLLQGLRPGLPAEPPAMVFGTPTKVLSEAGPAVEFMGANKVPDFQRFFQVTLISYLSFYQIFNILNTKQLFLLLFPS